jgi:hypothetical protein
MFTDNIFYLIYPGSFLCIRAYLGLTSVILILYAALVLDLTEV